MSLLDRPGLALWCVPAAWVVAMGPHFAAISMYGQLKKKSGKGFDNRSPRDSLRQVANDPNQTPLHRKIVRAEAAQTNGFEVIGYYAAAVVAATTARLPIRTTNTLAVSWLLVRVIYNLLYINTDDELISNARTASYLGSIGIIAALFIKSGNALASSLV